MLCTDTVNATDFSAIYRFPYESETNVKSNSFQAMKVEAISRMDSYLNREGIDDEPLSKRLADRYRDYFRDRYLKLHGLYGVT